MGTGRGRPRARTARGPPCTGASSRSASSRAACGRGRPSKAITAGPLRVRARELDRVLDRLGAGVEEGGLRGPGTDPRPPSAAAQLDVDLNGMIVKSGARSARAASCAAATTRGGEWPDVQATDPAGHAWTFSNQSPGLVLQLVLNMSPKATTIWKVCNRRPISWRKVMQRGPKSLGRPECYASVYIGALLASNNSRKYLFKTL